MSHQIVPTFRHLRLLLLVLDTLMETYILWNSSVFHVQTLSLENSKDRIGTWKVELLQRIMI